ncbi:MAG: Gfo/Idh/MocA family oxidoreductase [Acidobacteria bacterium]|nr:Gfo/Idh/MocA family oxidoreductase [Acidobacteriota bacterium]
MAERLTVGLVGCGRWGRHILRDLVSLGCDVLVATKSAESRKYASERGASLIVDEHEQLPELDGVVVATPTDTHAAVLEAVLERGVPVYSEKPLTCDAESAARLASAAPERLFVMDKWRYHPGIERRRKLTLWGSAA